MDGSMTSYMTLYQPESNNSYPVDYRLPNENVIRYDDARSTNIPVHLNTRSLKSNSLQYSYYGHPDNPSMSEERYRSMYQPTDDDEESVNPTVHPLSGERFCLQRTQPQDTNRSRVVVGNHGVYRQQAQDSLPNLPLPQESLPNLPVENHSLTSQYSSNNPHIHQNASRYHSHNHSATLGEVNHNVYQNQYGRSDSNVGVGQQNTSQEQAPRVIFPHRSAVLGEVRENLPVDVRRQDRHVSPGRELTSVHQPTSMGHSDPFTYNRMGVKEHSLMSERNHALDKQNPYNNTVAPTVRLIPTSNISLSRDQGGDYALGQGNQTQRVSSNHDTSWNQPVTSSNHRPQDYTPNQQPSAPVQYQMAPSHNRPHIEDKTSGHQYHDADYVGKKVFILHFGPTADTIDDNPILNLGVTLRRMKVDVTLDLFEYDTPPNSWPLWYEQKIKESDVVLCIITENFYQQLINNLVLGNSVYNLMNGSSSKSIAFRAVFIDAAKKEMEYIPPAMRGATSYSISSNRLTPNDEEFANLYAFLTGQNRVEKPPLGNRIVLAPKKSRFGHFSGGPAPARNNNNRNIQQQQWQPWQQQQGMMYQPAPPPQPSPVPAPNPGGMPNVEQANLIFTLLGGDATPIKSIRSHNKMFMQLASKMTAEWEGLGRLLNVNEPDIYAIKMDNIHSVTEQAVQMFRQWLMKNGSKATLGVLTTAVYDSGSQYWNLLDTINNYAPQQ